MESDLYKSDRGVLIHTKRAENISKHLFDYTVNVCFLADEEIKL